MGCSLSGGFRPPYDTALSKIDATAIPHGLYPQSDGSALPPGHDFVSRRTRSIAHRGNERPGGVPTWVSRLPAIDPDQPSWASVWHVTRSGEGRGRVDPVLNQLLRHRGIGSGGLVEEEPVL